MKWYEWVFDGMGTALISFISGFISYKVATKRISKQFQSAKNDSLQKQEMFIENGANESNVQDIIKQTQKAGDGADQIQCGGFKNGK